MTTLIHTSPMVIESIDSMGGCAENGTLFFSTNGYAMGNVVATYTLELDDEQIIHASDLDDSQSVILVSCLFDCSDEEAEELLTGEASELDYSDDAEKSWKLQGIRAEAAKRMGYVACEDEDENGVVYMIQMNDELLAKMELN